MRSLLEVDGKLDLLYNTFATEEKKEFGEELELFDAIDSVFNDLASEGRVEEGIKLLETLKELRPAQYMADYPYYDYYLLHYYAPLGEREQMKEIIEHFEEDPGKGLVMEYFGELPERRNGFFFSFSKEYLDKYLVSYFDFLFYASSKMIHQKKPKTFLFHMVNV